MGLDASVRCNCFEQGLMKNCPVDVNDVFVSDDGYLCSHKLVNAHRRFDFRRFEARYGRLEQAFEEWEGSACEHENGEFASEHISNWSGCNTFTYTVEEIGGMERFPLLCTMLPHANGGIFPADKAEAALCEVNSLIESLITSEDSEEEKFGIHIAKRIRRLLIASVKTGNPIRWE